MLRFNKILILFLTALFVALTFDVSGQYQVILDFETKDLDGNIEKLRDRLDPNKNYLFETMAFSSPEKLKIVIDINNNLAAGLRSSP